MSVEPLIASETVIVTAPDGVRQQVVVGLPVPAHLLVEYREALGEDTGPDDAPEKTANEAPIVPVVPAVVEKPETAAAKAKREKAERAAANGGT